MNDAHGKERLNVEGTASQTAPLLQVKDLHVSFFTPAGEVKAVNGISYTLRHGQIMGIVGESGSGKSVEAYSILGLLQPPGRVTGGSIRLEGEELIGKPEREMTQLRGRKVAMIFQNPMTCLNPVYPEMCIRDRACLLLDLLAEKREIKS